VLGTLTGIMAVTKTSAVKDQCNGNLCPASTRDDRDAAKTLSWVSNNSLGVGVVGAGVGTYFLLAKSSAARGASDPKSFTPVVAVDPRSQSLGLVKHF
jgi:hypothetical protein